ncbi:hypothetical protein DMB66_21065 [Actinoplanes sp. ATCC 53533]|uniref:ABC transporter substrate-binding protein n=1 Tax=Actinoplanes sp. ATCC 53533 TaxID=1288362 RepID=UPI000F791918|nr:extracellular solute-binding protein [Actinoplanes sp. ATCC 53533]RSM64128.1 hypothetical protein DMB66_21065 [Actinoplanes sp. ATCC 53533]
MSLNKRVLRFMLSGIVAATVAGCGISGDRAGAEATSLSFWLAQQTPQPIRDGIAAFGRENGIATEIVTVPDPFETNTLTKWAAGERPDVLYWQPATKFFIQLVPKANLQDLSGMDFVGRTRHRLAVESGALDGRTYTATVGFPAVFGIFYNKDVFARAGLTPPKNPGDLRAVCQQLKAAGVVPMSVAGGDPWTMQVPVYEMLTDAVAGGLIERINTARAAWTDPAVVAALRDFKGVVDAGFTNPDVATASYADQQADLLSGEVAMVAQGSWLISALTDTAGAERVDRSIGFAPWPSASGKVMWQSSNNASVMLPKTGNAARERAARDYVAYATSTGYRQALAAAKEPSVIDGIADPPGVSALRKAVADAYLNRSVPSVDMQAVASFGDFPTLMSELIMGRAGPEEVAGRMQEEFRRNAKLVGVEGF